MNGESIVFWVTAIFAVSGAVGMVISRKAVHSALWVAFTMINIAVLYFALEAAFLGTVQIVVYTGAVMMLFLFVLMIVGVDSSDSLLETIKGQRLVASLFGVAFGAMLIAGITSSGAVAARGLAAANGFRGSNIKGLAELIFGRYLLAFEVTSALLITAALGAMVLAHRERVTPRKTQAELQRERVMSGHPTPLPAPGVLATNNAVNVPALLPDGSASQESLPSQFKSNTDGDQNLPEVTR
jgi:NADH-quinone oxidoreductase subunit J